MSKSLRFVSIVIPVYNDSERLKRCLQVLEHQTYPKSQYEVIVVDNNSDDDIKSLVSHFPQALYEFEQKPGSYAARNKGIAVAKGAILGFTDSDCIPNSDWIDRGVSYLSDKCHYVAGRISIFFRNPERPTVPELYDSLNCLNQHYYIESVHYGATANLFVHKTLFDNVGLFNDSLKSGGDKEWGQRVFAANYQQVYAENAVVLHPARYSSREVAKKIARVTKGHCKVEKKHRRFSIELIKELYFSFKPPIRDAIKIFNNENLAGPGHRISYTCFFLYIQQVKAWTKAKYYLNSIKGSS